MEQNFSKSKDKICDSLKKAKTAEDFLSAQFLSSDLFYNKEDNEINAILAEQDNFYILAIENVFDNPNFVDAVGKVLEQYKSFQKNYDYKKEGEFFDNFDKVEIRNKKLIFAAFTTSLIFFVNVFQNLSQESVIYTAERLKGCLKRFKNNFNPQYSLSEIFTVISGVFNNKFYSRPTIPFNVKNLEYCFKKQKISNYLISIVIKISFKNARLNNLFKTIEKSRLEGKFGLYSIHRLSNLINSELENEKKSINELLLMLDNSKNLIFFVESFKKDRNEENAFNLIGLTLSKFEYSKTVENGLLSTIGSTEELTEKIKKYSIKNFKAFSGDITEDNYEWSNKVFINCSKLLGALRSLSAAVDKKWQIDASTKEFADWVCSIHKILNKYDIEDDWDKISKYLNQETNRVEWKSNFFTPTQVKKDDLQYHDIAKKCFLKIIKTILGMINTDGGVIIVGIVEKPEEIMDTDIRNSLLQKNKKFLFNVSEELFNKKLDLDGIKRKIQDSLKTETLMSVDKFNDLWSIKQINIKSEDGTREFSIYKIEVTKSDKSIFSVKLEKESKDSEKINIYKSENIWVSLLKRADSRTIYVDPRKELDLFD